MSYIDELTKQVNQVFDQAQDETALRQDVLELVIAKSKESFKNGLEVARKRQNKAKGHNNAKAEQK